MIKKTVLTLSLTLGLLYADALDERKQGIGLSLGLMGFGVSYFDKTRSAEIFGSYYRYEDSTNWYDASLDKEQSETLINLHYRKFFKKQIGGWYYGGFAQYARLDGKLKNEHKRATQDKIGIGAEIGYSAFGLLGYPTLYWNSGFGLGGYISGDAEIFEGDELMSDLPVMIHFDLIRIGLVF